MKEESKPNVKLSFVFLVDNKVVPVAYAIFDASIISRIALAMKF